MSCDGELHHNQTGPTPTPLHRLDASLFYSAAAAADDDDDVNELSETAPSAGQGQGIYDEYRVDTPHSQRQAASSSTPVFTLSDVTDAVDSHLLRAVFLLSDIVVLVYRLTSTCVMVRALRQRFTACTMRRHVPAGQSGGQGHVMTDRDGGSTSSRTALTSMSGVPDTSNIYTDPQSLVVDNCATLVHRRATASCPHRRSDAKYRSGQPDGVLAITT